MSSLLEQKRLQWAAERAQMKEWDPWGRPGGGAPMVIPDNKTHWNKVTTMHLPPLPNVTGSPPNVNPRPMVPSRHKDSKYEWQEETNDEKWAVERGGHREELQPPQNHREKDFYDKQILVNNLVHQSEAPLNNLSGVNDDGLGVGTRWDRDSTMDHWNENHRTPTSAEWNHPPGIRDGNDQKNNEPWSQRTFLRGANIPLDAHSQVELAVKKEKALEQQRAIRSQLEERQRLKQAEEERRKQEEWEEEQRLVRERQRLDREFQTEQQKLKLKEETDLKRREALSEILRDSHQSLPMLREVPQDAVRHLPDVLDGTPKSTQACKGLCQALDTDSHGRHLADGIAPYVCDRVLTPTKYRGLNVVMRDCGTQTEFPFVGVTPSRRHQGTTTTDTEATTKGQRNKSRAPKKKPTRTGTKRQKPSLGVGSDCGFSESPSGSSEIWKSGILCRVQEATVLEHPNPCVDRKPVATRSSRTARTRSRSSAEHRRKPLPRERAPSLDHRSQMACSSPSLSVQSNDTGDTAVGSQPVAPPSRENRKPRRQWESPRRHEMPAFYTDSSQLLDSRTVRRGNPVPKKASSAPDLPTPDDRTDVSVFRSDSPPVPALRRRLVGENSGNLEPWPPAPDDGGIDHSHDGTGNSTLVVGVESSHGPERLNLPDITRNQAGNGAPTKPEHSHSHAGVPNLRSDPSMSKPARGSFTAPSLVQDAKLFESTWSLATPSAEQQSRVLQKLGLIRQGLLLKQRELDCLVEKFDNITNECQQLELIHLERP